MKIVSLKDVAFRIVIKFVDASGEKFVGVKN